MMRKSKAFHSLDSLMDAGTTAQDLETKIEEERKKRRLSNESQYSTGTPASTEGHQVLDLHGLFAALDDIFVADFPLIAWDSEQDVK